MTRQGLGQREVAPRSELIIDIARYAKAPNVDSFDLFRVLDPQRRCPNPAALENDRTREEAFTSGRLPLSARTARKCRGTEPYDHSELDLFPEQNHWEEKESLPPVFTTFGYRPAATSDTTD